MSTSPAHDGRGAPAPTVVTSELFDNGVLHLHLLGGARRNVLGRATLSQLEGHLSTPPAGTRVVLISADGPDFCAGYDLFEASRGRAEELIAHPGHFASLRRCSVPVVALLHGQVIGGGLELALLADVRLAAAGTSFSIPAARLGLVYSEAGVRLLLEELGSSVARSMLLGGHVVDARLAQRVGLVQEVVALPQLHARGLELAGTIASWPAIATSGNRLVLDVAAGRAEADTAALRLASFAERGPLMASIARFTARRPPSPARAPAAVLAARRAWQRGSGVLGQSEEVALERLGRLRALLAESGLARGGLGRRLRPTHPAHSPL